MKTSNDHCIETTYPIELKFTGLIEQVNKDLFTNFQSIQNFHKNFTIFKLKIYKGLLWSWNDTCKLKQLKELLIYTKNRSKIT